MIDLTKRALLGAAFAAPLASLPATAQARVVDNNGTGLSFHKLDEAIDAHPCPGGLIMDRWMRNMMSAGSRSTNPGGFLVWTSDHTGYRRASYNDLPIFTPAVSSRYRMLGDARTFNTILVVPASGDVLTGDIPDEAIAMIRYHPLTVALVGIAPLTPVR